MLGRTAGVHSLVVIGLGAVVKSYPAASRRFGLTERTFNRPSSLPQVTGHHPERGNPVGRGRAPRGRP
jgi:hypothetical protein